MGALLLLLVGLAMVWGAMRLDHYSFQLRGWKKILGQFIALCLMGGGFIATYPMILIILAWWNQP